MKRRIWLVLGGLALTAAVAHWLPTPATSGGVRIATRPWASLLREAVASRDSGAIIRAFRAAIYTVGYPVHDPRTALPAVRAYLHHADPFVRYTAAETLYTAGDDSGYETLLAMVRADAPLPFSLDVPELKGRGEPGWDHPPAQDLRAKAAKVLAKFRERRAAETVADAYRRTGDNDFFAALVKLGASPLVEDAWRHGTHRHETSGYGAAIFYADVGAAELVPDLAATFDRTKDPRLKVEAAYALARMAGDGRAIEHLVAVARECVARRPTLQGEREFDHRSAALEYLASLRRPEAVRVLEEALDSENPVAVEYAVVNLLFNHGHEAEAARTKARTLLLRELHFGPDARLGYHLAMEIAMALDDPEVSALARAHDPDGVSLQFWYRRSWPVYDWIDDYTVTLNDLALIPRPPRDGA
jgi:HEAT repeat protein